MTATSRVPEFYKKSVEEKIKIVGDFAGLNDDDVELLRKLMREQDYNYSVVPNFKINGKDYFIPMETEERAIIPAASNGGKLTRHGDGIRATHIGLYMKGQIQIAKLEDPIIAKENLEQEKDLILENANRGHKHCKVVNLEFKKLKTELGYMLLVEPIVDVGDAMGANTVNSMCEAITPLIEKITGGKVYSRILTNLSDKRMVRAEVELPKEIFEEETINGEEAFESIMYAQVLADYDIYRASTHNKGIMNGVDAVAAATGNDTRAIETGAHAYAAMKGKYLPLSKWCVDGNKLRGRLEMPLAVGVVGGATGGPKARLSRKILGVNHAYELAEVMGAVGLATNLVALLALSTEGIQAGYDRLEKKGSYLRHQS